MVVGGGGGGGRRVWTWLDKSGIFILTLKCWRARTEPRLEPCSGVSASNLSPGRVCHYFLNNLDSIRQYLKKNNNFKMSSLSPTEPFQIQDICSSAVPDIVHLRTAVSCSVQLLYSIAPKFSIAVFRTIHLPDLLRYCSPAVQLSWGVPG
jgi:hypothetical protein